MKVFHISKKTTIPQSWKFKKNQCNIFVKSRKCQSLKRCYPIHSWNSSRTYRTWKQPSTTTTSNRSWTCSPTSASTHVQSSLQSSATRVWTRGVSTCSKCSNACSSVSPSCLWTRLNQTICTYTTSMRTFGILSMKWLRISQMLSRKSTGNYKTCWSACLSVWRPSFCFRKGFWTSFHSVVLVAFKFNESWVRTFI